MRLFLIIILTFIVSPAAAQNCNFTLKGLIEDSEGVYMPGATILIQKLNAGHVSKDDGSFQIDSLCTGEYGVVVKFLGYEDQQVTVRIPYQRTLVVKLKTSVNVLHDVVIESDHIKQHGLSQSASLISTDDLDALKGKPLGELLKQVPGVTALMTGPGIFKPVIHGLHSQRILILNNGIRQEGQQWGIEHAPEIDTYIASEIEVVKGAETVRYGADAMGGVVILNAPPLHQTLALGGEFNLGAMSNNRMGILSAMVEGGFKRRNAWSWRLQSTAKQGGDFSTPTYNLSNTGIQELNFSGTLGFKNKGKELVIYISSFNTTIGILRSAHTGNLEDLQSSIVNEMPWYIKDFSYDINNPKQKISHQLLKIQASRKFRNIGVVNVLYGVQYNRRKEFDIRRGGRSSTPSLSLNLFSNVLDLSMDHKLGQWDGTIGTNGSFKANVNDPETNITPLVPDYNQLTTGIFLIEKLRRAKWLVELGGRYDHQYLIVKTFNTNKELTKPVFNFNYFAGSIGFSYYFNQIMRMTSNASASTRPPHVSELFSNGLHHGNASIEEGLMYRNGELMTNQSFAKAEYSYKWINTFQFTNAKFTVDVTGFINSIKNYIYLTPYQTRLTIRGYFPVFEYNQTNAMLTGGDAALIWRTTKRINYQGRFSYLYAYDVSNDGRLPFISPAQFENALSYTWQTIGAWKDVYLKIAVPTTLKQTHAPATVYPKDVADTEIKETFDFMPAPSTYTLLNFEIGAKLPLDNREISVILTAENLLNDSYRNYMNRLRYYADDIGRNFSLRVKYNFHAH